MNTDEQIRTCEYCEQDHNKEMDEHSQAVAATDAGPPNIVNAFLVDVVAAAALCGISRTQFYKLHSSGKTPASVKLGRCARWNRDELRAWTAAGCPARAKWEIMRNEK